MDKKKVVDDYKEVIGALQSCKSDCRDCDELSECIHWIRQILVVVLKYIIDSIQYDVKEAVMEGFEKVIEEQKDEKTIKKLDKETTGFYS